MPIIPQQPSSNGNGKRRGQVVDIGDRFGPGRNPSQPLESGDSRWHDPADDVEGMPPNFGDFPLPHVYTFSGIFGSPSNVYRISDEALRHSYDNSRYMLNDPTLTECLEQRQRSLALLDWHLETDDPDDPLHKDVVERLTQLIKLTPRFMQYRENLHRAIWFGRSANTHRWRWRKVEGQMRLVLDRWNPVHGDKLVFRFDRNFGGYNPDQIGIRVGAAYKMGDKVTDRWKVEQVSHKMLPTDAGLAYFLEPGERHLIAIHKHLIEDGEWETPEYAGRVNGVGIRSKIYWTWYMKQECQAWLLEFLERSAFGVEIWTYPYGNEEARDQAKQAATERIGNGRNVVLFPKPPGEEGVYGYDRIEPAMAGAEVLKEIMHGYFGHVMKRYILGQTLTSEAAPTGLGSNLASIHLDTYLQIVRYDAVNLQETLTTDLVEPLKLLNSGTHGFPVCGDLPVRFVIDTESDDAQNKLQLYQAAFNMGVGLKESELMEIIGAQMPQADDKVLRVTDLNAAAQPMDAGAAAGGQQPMSTDEGAAVVADAIAGGAIEPQSPDESGAVESYSKDRIPGGLADDRDSDDFDPEQLRVGTEVEMEHTSDPTIACEIAMDHLTEDPDYYRKLKRVEKFARISTLQSLLAEREDPDLRRELERYKKDSSGHEHAPKGSSKGGQFVSSGGSSDKADGDDEKIHPIKSKAKVIYKSSVPYRRSEADEVLRNTLGTDDLETVASVVGAPDDATVEVEWVWNTDYTAKLARITIKHRDFIAVRRIGTTKSDGRPVIYNQEFFVNKSAQNKGIGLDIFTRQVENASAAGVAWIRCHAARSSTSGKPDYNGYYTWPRFGYDQSLSDLSGIAEEDNSVFEATRKKFPNAKTVLDVMETSEGREWWKQNGTDLLNAKFDLNKGSRSMQILEKYQRERDDRKKLT